MDKVSPYDLKKPRTRVIFVKEQYLSYGGQNRKFPQPVRNNKGSQMEDTLEVKSTKEPGGVGWISNLQDFVVHDGPGLRVLLFLRGCPLRCRWCQNPENLDLSPQIEYHQSRCIGCLRCMEVCPIPGAIVEDAEQRIDRSKCNNCMACADVCLGKALEKVGQQMSVQEAVKKIMAYRPFFDHSDRGGVTLSGGDPILQPEFTLGLLKALREQGIHTTVETSGYTSYEALKKIVENADLIIYDIKHMDEDRHVAGTGRSNLIILENLRRLCDEVDTEIAVHVPLIPAFNDNEENIKSTADFVRSLQKIKHIDLLPFNELASEKYAALGLDWEYADTQRQSPEHLDRLKDIVESYGLEVTIGGLW